MVKDKSGVTLIELIMVMVVVGVLGGGLSLGIKEAIDLYSFLTFRNEIVSQGRMALMRMAREVRQAKRRTPAYEPIKQAETYLLRFIDTNDNDITYCRADVNCSCDSNGDFLCRNNNTLASNIGNESGRPLFRYYRQGNDEIDPPPGTDEDGCSEIYRIAIELLISRDNRSLDVKTEIFPRNFGF